MPDSVKFRFAADYLTVEELRNGFRSPSTGVVYPLLSKAVRAECGASLRASGDDPADFVDEIDAALVAAYQAQADADFGG